MAKKLTDDEKDKHPFYSSYALEEWKRRIKEKTSEEAETAEANARKYREAEEARKVEKGRSRKSKSPMRMVSSGEVSECTPHNQSETEESTN